MKSCKQKHSFENFVREMLIRTLSTNLLQIFCEIFLNSKVIVKSIIDPDDNFYGNSVSINGLHMSPAWGQVSALRPDSMQVFASSGGHFLSCDSSMASVCHGVRQSELKP